MSEFFIWKEGFWKSVSDVICIAIFILGDFFYYLCRLHIRK